jgi:hypothetical protein
MLSLITAPNPTGPRLPFEAPSKFSFQKLGGGQLHVEGLREVGVEGDVRVRGALGVISCQEEKIRDLGGSM